MLVNQLELVAVRNYGSGKGPARTGSSHEKDRAVEDRAGAGAGGDLRIRGGPFRGGHPRGERVFLPARGECPRQPGHQRREPGGRRRRRPRRHPVRGPGPAVGDGAGRAQLRDLGRRPPAGGLDHRPGDGPGLADRGDTLELQRRRLDSLPPHLRRRHGLLRQRRQARLRPGRGHRRPGLVVPGGRGGPLTAAGGGRDGLLHLRQQPGL